MILTHHNVDFNINTSEWSDAESQERVTSKLEQWILSLTREQVGELYEFWAITGDYPNQIAEFADSVFANEVKDYATYPYTGHNCSIGLCE